MVRIRPCDMEFLFPFGQKVFVHVVKANFVSVREHVVTREKGRGLFFFFALFGDVPAEEVNGSDVTVFLRLTDERVD